MNNPDDQEQWAAMLAADPALRAAWDTFQTTLETKARQIKNGETPDQGDLRRACDAVYAETGEGQKRH